MPKSKTSNATFWVIFKQHVWGTQNILKATVIATQQSSGGVVNANLNSTPTTSPTSQAGSCNGCNAKTTLNLFFLLSIVMSRLVLL